MVDYTSKSDLVEKLIKMGKKKEDIENLKRTDLIQLIGESESENSEKDAEKATEAMENNNVTKSHTINVLDIEKATENEKPSETDILSSLNKDEIYVTKDGNQIAKAMGLRRLIDEKYGIFSEKVQVMQSPNNTNGLIGCVVYYATLTDGSTICGSADAGPHNCDDTFKIYPIAIAETRARARAYRFKFAISSPAYEELQKDPESETLQVEKDGQIAPEQIKAIETVAEKCCVDINKWLTRNMKGKSINNLTWEEAVAFIKQLNLYNNNGNTPDDIKKDGVNNE